MNEEEFKDLIERGKKLMLHEVKTLPEHFQAVLSGDKTAEIRINDRDYKVEDTLILKEWKPDIGFTRCHIATTITHIIDDKQDGIEEGFVMLSFVKNIR